MSIGRMYVPSDGQLDGPSRAAALNAGLSVTETADAPRYAAIKPQLPCVVLEYGGTIVTIAEPTTLAVVDAAAAQLQAQADADAQTAANQQTIQQAARTALTNNQAFLGLASPTNAQAVAQVTALTRQVDGLIRLVLGQFDSTS